MKKDINLNAFATLKRLKLLAEKATLKYFEQQGWMKIEDFGEGQGYRRSWTKENSENMIESARPFKDAATPDTILKLIEALEISNAALEKYSRASVEVFTELDPNKTMALRSHAIEALDKIQRLLEGI